MNKNQAIGLTLAVFVVISGGIAALVFSGGSSVDKTVDQSTSAPIDDTQTSQLANPDAVVTGRAEATLGAVNDYEGFATATRQLTDGQYAHEVIASIGDPAEGKFYEGWIVGARIVSTGKMVKESEGEYSLVFNGDAEFIDFNQVVITEETESNGLDGIPETHVFEGSF